MNRFRTLLFWTHLTVGAVAGVVILIMSVTGVALTYEKQVIEWADRRAAVLAPASSPLPPEQLIGAAASTHPELAVIGLIMRAWQPTRRRRL